MKGNANRPRIARAWVTYTPKGKKSSRTSSTIANYEEGFTYVDVATGESDTMSLKVCNRDLRWANKWMPKKGDKMTAKIKVYSWDKAGRDQVFQCGKFCCDDLSFSGPTFVAEISGTSVPEGQAFRSTQRTYTWKKVTTSEIARKIAKRYNLRLYYQASNIYINSMEQSKQTDCEFLNKLCEDYGMNIKVYYGKIIIYDAVKYEAKKAVATFNIKNLEDWDYNTTLVGTYTGATITYTNGKSTRKKSSSSNELKLKVGSGSRILNINEKVDNASDARRKACAKVNKENRSAVTMTATIRPNLKVVAGVCIKITGAYKLNGKYFVDKVTHKLEAGSAYTMSLEMHKVQKAIK